MIMKLYNETVYGGALICQSPKSSYDFEGWSELQGKPPIIFHHCEGAEQRMKASPSWMNPEEVVVVRDYLEKLADMPEPPKPEDVGIISPYRLQCESLRLMCQGEEFPASVGTTEQFQGQERRIIIISTVRSKKKDEVSRDLRFALGFVGSYKRSNVALSRAKALVILVGNLNLLSMDEHWNQVIRIAHRLGCCRGNFELSKVEVVDDGIHVAQGHQAEAAAEAAGRPWRELM